MDIATKLDEHGKGAWLLLMIASFVLFWPVGLAILAYMIWSGRMGCRNSAFKEEWRGYKQEWRARKREMRDRMRATRNYSHNAFASSGNSAFDAYKEETLRRLEEEQQEFNDFLDNLRKARDKAEFDQFMAHRRHVVESEDPSQPPAADTAPSY